MVPIHGTQADDTGLTGRVGKYPNGTQSQWLVAARGRGEVGRLAFNDPAVTIQRGRHELC